MKNKIIIILVLIIILYPPISHAVIMVPITNLTVVVNTQGSDATFHFNLQGVQEFEWS